MEHNPGDLYESPYFNNDLFILVSKTETECVLFDVRNNSQLGCNITALQKDLKKVS